MKKGLGLAAVLSLCLFAEGCATSNIILFEKSTTGQPPASRRPPDLVEIYRMTNPFSDFKEIGIITFRTSSFDLPWIYSRLRKDSSASGADAVVNLKVSGESHEESHEVQDCIPETSCDINGNCETHDKCTERTVWETASSYLVEGSMIRVNAVAGSRAERNKIP